MGSGPNHEDLASKYGGYYPSKQDNADDLPNTEGHNNSSDVYLYICLSVFFVSLAILPFILRKCGYFPSRVRLTPRERQRMEQYEAKTTEERKKIIYDSLNITAFAIIEDAEHGGTSAVATSNEVCKELDDSITSVTQLSTSSSSSSSNNKDKDDGVDDDNDKPCCQICLEHFEIDEKIASSKVSKCQHYFHEDCIVEWLLKSGQCPSCRALYLKLKDNEDEANTNNTSDVAIVVEGTAGEGAGDEEQGGIGESSPGPFQIQEAEDSILSVPNVGTTEDP